MYLQLFLTFCKIGAFTFGGGWAMISIIQREIVEKHHWIELEDFLDLLAVAQSNDLVLTDPASEVFVHQHGQYGLGVKLRVWVKPADYWTVYFDMWEDVKKAFDKFGIEIPYQVLKVNMDNSAE